MGFLLPTTKVSVSQGKTDEFGVTSSDYDKEIPIGYGIDRLPGNIIWANNIQQEKVVTVTKQGGKGSPKTKTTTTTYLYYVDLAVLLCTGPITDVYRIWADGKVIYNSATGEAIDGLDFRLYRGTDDQMPDPLIELDVGEGLTPAYRGSAYIVFERLPLQNFGNRIPGFTFEVAFTGDSASQFVATTISHEFTNSIFSGDGGGTYTAEPIQIAGRLNWRWSYTSNLLYHAATDHGSAGASALINPVTKTMTGIPSRTTPINNGTNTVNGIHEPTGNYTVGQVENVGGERRDMFLRDVDTAATLLTADADFSARQLFGQAMDVGGVVVSIGTDSSSGDLDHLGWKAVNLNDPDVVGTFAWEAGYQYHPPKLGRTTANLSGSGVFAEAFGLRVTSSTIEVVQIVAPNAASVVMNVIETINVTDVVPGATSWNTNPAWEVSRVSGEIYVQSTIDGTPYIWCWSPNTSSVEWVTEVAHVLTGVLDLVDSSGSIISDIPLRNGTSGANLIVGNNWVWVDSNKRVIRVSLASGQVDTIFNGTTVFDDIGEASVGNTGGERSRFHWNDATSTLVNVIDNDLDDSPAGVYFYQFSFLQGGDVNPQEIIADLCSKAGLTASDIDVSAVPTLQEGLRSVVAFERGTVSETIGPLLDLLELEIVESDFKLKFFPRGSVSSVATITEDDLVPTGDNQFEAYVQAFSKEEDLPRRFEVSYRDFTLDYQESVGADERSEVSQFSQSVEGFQFNGSCTADLPRRSAQVKLYSAWAEREKIRSRLPHRYLRLDAGDVITLQLDNGSEVTGRLRQASIGADLTVDFEQVAETTGVYESDIEGAVSDGHFETVIPNIGDSALGLLDVPLIRDVDSAGSTQTNTYWVANGAPVWPGVINYRETGTSTVQEVGQQTLGAPYGVLGTVPPDMDRSVNRFTDDSFQVVIANGIDEFESVSEADALAGRNLLAIVKTNGEVELLTFTTVSVLSASTVELSGLLRGRRGTDTMANGFTVGERVFLLDAAWTDRFSLDLSTVGSGQTYRGVTIGQLYEDADQVVFTNTARDLKPYAPAHVAVQDDGAGGLDISWTRRTRIGGESDWLLSGDVPLSETDEAYSVDVLDAPGGSVLRTLTSSSETVNYAAADITTDFGSLPATIDLVVYQVSTEVGRGFPAAASLSTG